MFKFQGKTVVAIETIMKCSRRVVCTTLKHFKDNGFFFKRPKTGRNLKTSAISDRLLKLLVLREEKMSKNLSSKLTQCHLKVKISFRTLRKQIEDVEVRECKARHIPLLNRDHQKKQLLWARKHRHMLKTGPRSCGLMNVTS